VIAGPSSDATVAAPYVPTRGPAYPLALPPYPSGLARFPDSNPTPAGWSIVTDDKLEPGGRCEGRGDLVCHISRGRIENGTPAY